MKMLLHTSVDVPVLGKVTAALYQESGTDTLILEVHTALGCWHFEGGRMVC